MITQLFKKSFFATFVMALSINLAHAHFTTKGPYGGSVTCLLATDTLVFVGTANGGVFRTTNTAATSWRYANYTGLSNGSINALAAIGQYVIAGTPTGAFKSSDAGNSWTASNSGLSNPDILALIAADDHMIAGTNGGGVYLSHDSGSTWEQSNVGLTNLIVTGFAFDGTTIYAATQAGVFSSVDEGDSWTAMNTGLTDLMIHTIAVSGNNIFVANTNGVFVTANTATNWTQQNMGLDTLVNHLYANNGIMYASTNSGVYTSPDQNIQWTAAQTGYSGNVMATAVYSGKLFAGTKNDGLYRSSSLTSIDWSEFNTGFNNLETYAIYNSGTLVIAATNKGLFVSNDLAANYMRSNSGLTDSLHITDLSFAGNKLYVSTQNAGVFESADTGITWTQVNNGLTNTHILKLIANNSFLFAAAASGEVYNTPLSAITWSTTSGLPAAITPTSFATDGSSHVFLGTQSQGVFMCMDNQNWMASNSGLSNLNVTSLVITGTELFAGTNGGGVFKRELMGSWSAAGTGLPTQTITSLGTAGQWVAAGFKGGVYVSYDNGTTWKAPNVMQYIPEYADVTAISFSSTSTRIFVATPYNCLYSNGIGELPTGLQTIAQAKVHFSVYPNPSNGTFSIGLEDRSVSLEGVSVYNQLGQLVYQSARKNNNPTEVISLSVPSGIYFVNLQTNKGPVSAKLIIE
jgi:hypothetical protein